MSKNLLRSAISSKYLMDDRAIVVLPELANLFGLEEATFLQQVHYFVVRKDGQPVYNTVNQWHEHLTFISVRSLERIIKKLKKIGVLNSEVTKTFTKTTYYSINYDVLNELVNEKNVNAETDTAKLAVSGKKTFETAKMADSDRQIGGFDTANLAVSLYSTKISTKTTTTETKKTEGSHSEEQRFILPSIIKNDDQLDVRFQLERLANVDVSTIVVNGTQGRTLEQVAQMILDELWANNKTKPINNVVGYVRALVDKVLTGVITFEKHSQGKMARENDKIQKVKTLEGTA